MHWVTKRIGRAILTVFLVVNLSFLAIRQLPGGPMDYLLAQLSQMSSGMDEDRMEAIAETYLAVNPSESLQDQYVDYMVALLQGDFGRSIYYNEPVASIYAKAIPWTLFVLILGTILTYGGGIVLGMLMAHHEGSRFDSSSSVISIVMNSIPYYILAILFAFVIGDLWGILPATGRYNTATTPGVNWPFIVGVIKHATLPIASLVLTGFGGWALAMRGNSISILGADYLRVARLRGIAENRIATRYIGWNAILPLYTSLMISLGFIFGGSVVLEQIFVYRGVGFYLFQGISARDYPLMMGGFIIITLAVICGLIIAELTYGFIDPRAREGGENEAY